MNSRLKNLIPAIAFVLLFSVYGNGLLAKPLIIGDLFEEKTPLLESGDLAIIRIKGEGTFDFSFVTFVEMQPGTTLYFTDCGALGEGLVSPCTEGALKYIVPEEGLKVGQIVHYIDNPNFSNYNDLTITDAFRWDEGGDQLLVFQDIDDTNEIPAGAEPYFIYAVNLASRHFDNNANPGDVNQTRLPFMLYDTSNPRTALGLGRGNGPEDAWKNSVYEGPFEFQTLDDAIQHITYSLNYHGDDDSASDKFIAFSEAIPNQLTIGFPLRVTEIMPNPKAVSDTKGEYIEIYNKEETPVDIEGWTLSDDDGDKHVIQNEGQGVLVPAKGFLVLGINGDPSSNGGVAVDYVYEDFRLGNYDDRIILTDTQGREHDRVEYDLLNSTTWPYRPNGQALVFVGMEDEDNNFGGLWSLSSTSEGITGDMGSPGISGAEQFLAPEVCDNMITYQNGAWSVEPGPDTQDMYAVVIEGRPVFSDDVHLAGLQVRHGTSVDVKAVLKIEKHLIVKGDLTFKADATYRGELDVLPDDAVYYGEVTVETYYDGKSAYNLVSSPVNTGRGTIFENWQEDGKANPNFGTHITGGYGPWGTITTDGFDATPAGTVSMYYLDQVGQRLKPVENTNSTSLNAGESFMMMVKGDRTIDLNEQGEHNATTLRTRGTLERGTISKEIAAYVDKDANPGTKDLLLTGNPYASTIAVKPLLAAAENKNINPNFYYVFDPSLGSGEIEGGFVAIAAADGASATAYTGAGFLAPGQAFQVEMLEDNQETALIFKEAYKTPGITGNEGTVASESLSLVVQLFTKQNFDENKNPQDGVLVRFGENYSDARDSRDAAKLFNNNESLATSLSGALLAIDHRKLPKSGSVIDLFAVNFTTEEYVLKIITDEYDGVQPYLLDTYTGERTILETGENHIDFQITGDYQSRTPHRFQIQFDAKLGVDGPQLAGTSIYPNPVVGDVLTITLPGTAGPFVKVAVVDVSGRTVFNEELTTENSAVQIDARKYLSNGVYLVHLETDGLAAVHKIIRQ